MSRKGPFATMHQVNTVKTVDDTSICTRNHRLFSVAVALLLLLALALRLWAAWHTRIPTDPDAAAVHLMTRAIARGETLLFFWNQAYLAPFEQTLGALFLRLGCPLLFAPPLATAVFSLAVFALALRLCFLALGRKATLLAGLLLLAGPAEFAAYQVACRGGYMGILLFSLLALHCGSRLAEEIRSNASPARVVFLASVLGILAGLGIWQSFLVIPAFAAAGCGIILALFRSHATGKKWFAVATAGFAGVLLGGAPFWIYNASHALASFDFSQNALSIPSGKRMVFAWRNFIRLFAREAAWAPWAAAATLVALAAAGAVLWKGRASRSRRSNEILLEGGLFLVFLVAVYISSGFVATPTARYLLPAVPLLAMALAALLSRIPGGWVLAVLLAVVQPASASARCRLSAEKGVQNGQRAANFEAAAREAEADAIYAPIGLFPLNVHLPDDLPLVPVRKAFSPHLRQAAELACNPLYHADEARFKGFLRQSGGKAKRFGRLFGKARPPAWNRGREIPPGAFAGPIELTDGRTTALSAHPKGVAVDFEWTFPASQDIGFLFLRFSAAKGHEVFIVERDAGDGTWEIVVPRTELARWAWSGPRAYPESADLAILALDGKPAKRLRLSVGGRGWALQEVLLLSPAGNPAPDNPGAFRAEEDAAWKTVAEEIRGGALFAGGRWAANRVAEAGGDPAAIWGLEPMAWPESRRTGELPAGKRLVVAAEGAHAATVRRNWKGNGLESESPAGDWTVFRGISPEGVFWDGTTLLRVR